MSTQQNTEHSPEQSKAQMNAEDFQAVTLSLSLGASVSEIGYYELEEVPVRTVDPLLQLKQNTDRLQEMSARFAFLNREVRYLLKV
jgi:hypothetical protein